MNEAEKQAHRDRARQSVLFRHLSDDSFKSFFDDGKLEKFEEGESIIEEGDASPHLYFVLEGSVNIMVTDGDGQVFISALGRGQIFGEAAIFASVKRTASVVSANTSVLLRVGRTELLSFIRTFPSDGIKLLMIIIFSLLKKLREANQELAFERKFDVGQEDIDAIVEEIVAGG